MKSVDRRGGHAQKPVALLALCAGLCTLCFYVVEGRAGAAIDGTLLTVGSDALTFPGIRPSTAGVIRVNGAEVRFRVDSVRVPIAELYEYYARTCSGTSASGPMGSLLRAIATRGTLSDSHAFVACVELSRDDPPAITSRLEEFVRTGDLSTLGALRYVYARKDTANPAVTLSFTMWTDGPFELHNFIPPKDGDTPGTDLRYVPRPRASSRILSIDHASYRLAVYRVRGVEPMRQASWYSARFASNGWRTVRSRRSDVVDVDGSLLVAAESGSRMATVIVSEDAPGRVVVTALETGTSP